MTKRIASIVALLLVVCMVLPMASCGKVKVEEFVGDYTYNDSVVTMSSNWNPHTYQVQDDSYPISYITTGLYGFFFNENFDGYVIKPEMAAADPVPIKKIQVS